jgi:hypothetical protein
MLQKKIRIILFYYSKLMDIRSKIMVISIINWKIVCNNYYSIITN